MANYSDIKYQPAGAATTIYSDMAALIAATGMSAGDQALVTALNKVFMYTGTAWYLVATMTNDSPTAITGVSGSYGLATDGTATTITAVSTDPEGFPLTWSYAVTTGSLGSTATVSQADNVFTITPSSTPADVGSFSITFSVTDGTTGAVNAVSAFTLAFIVTNSRYTALSVKATATGSNQTFDDASASNHTITVAGNSTASTFSPHRHGGYSLRFENSVADDNNIKFDNTTGSGAVAASGEFCVETWVKFTVNSVPSGTANARIFASNGSGGNAADNLQLFPEYSGSYIGAVSVYTNGFVYQANATTEVINDGQWHHLAVTRDSSNNLRWFIDGTLITTIASNTTTFQFEQTRLGKRDGGTGHSCFTGDMRDTRVVIGSSVYESAFTPPTEPLTAITNTYLLVGDLPYIKDESTNNFSINAGTYNNGSNVLLPKKVPLSLFDNGAYLEASHGASAYFDGSGDWLYTVNQNIPTGSYQVDGWFYAKDTNNVCIFSQGTSGNSNRTGLWINGVGNGYISFYVGTNGSGGTGNNDASSWGNTTIPSNQWTHFATTYNGSQIELFINGISLGTASNTNDAESNTPFYIGAFAYNSAPAFNGYMSDIRISDTVRNTSNFTPPTSPHTPDSNTKFLLNPETSISDLSQSSVITCVGDAATDATTVKFAGTKSIAFDGTGDYLSISNFIDLGTDSWTIEGWYWFDNFSTNQGMFQVGRTDGSLGVMVHNSDKVKVVDSFISTPVTSNTSISAQSWTHIAITFTDSDNTIRIFINGNLDSNTGTKSSAWTFTEKTFQLGARYYSSAVQVPMTGYVQDFRITKDLARYTANFTPPTTELEG